MHVIKDNLFPVPPLFRLIQQESATPWQEMYQVFNMGHRMELYVPEKIVQTIIGIAGEFKIEARVIGHCESDKGSRLTLKSPFGEFQY
jgi:phosphoribosylformylglycinamidine cyclo-ligase